MLQYFPVWR